MSQTIQAALRHLHGAAALPGADSSTDAELLERFVSQDDRLAFTTLVARHGPMVLGVCRRLLQDAHDAEDAFQATFLVLAHKAATLVGTGPLGAWLYGVASRTAAHARADRARRIVRERRAPTHTAIESTPALVWEDLRPVLDEEIQRLPTEYRVLVVLCYLDGRTYDEAAREIGCPKGTVATRLTKARELLRDRLSGRDVTLPAVGLATIITENARSAVPSTLLHATEQAATMSVASEAVRTLTEGVLTAMFLSKMKSVTTLLVCVGLLAATGMGLFAFVHDSSGATAAPADSKPGEGAGNPTDAPEQAQGGWLRVHETGNDGRALQFRPDGTRRTEVAVSKRRRSYPSPDGKHILSVKGTVNETAIFISDAEGKAERQLSPDKVVAVFPRWSPDGKRIAFLGKDGEHWQIHEMNSDGGEHRKITDLPNGAWMPAYAPDGRLSYLAFHEHQKYQTADLLLRDGKSTKAIVENIYISDYAWSPDSNRIAYGGMGMLVFHSVQTGEEQEIVFADIEEQLRGYAAGMICWSPDSRSVACTITFLGDRRAGGPKLFGDDELFVIPRNGKAHWFQPGIVFHDLEWLTHDEAVPRDDEKLRVILARQKGTQLKFYMNSNGTYINGKSVSTEEIQEIVRRSRLEQAVIAVEPYISYKKIARAQELIRDAGVKDIRFVTPKAK